MCCPFPWIKIIIHSLINLTLASKARQLTSISARTSPVPRTALLTTDTLKRKTNTYEAPPFAGL